MLATYINHVKYKVRIWSSGNHSCDICFTNAENVVVIKLLPIWVALSTNILTISKGLGLRVTYPMLKVPISYDTAPKIAGLTPVVTADEPPVEIRLRLHLSLLRNEPAIVQYMFQI